MYLFFFFFKQKTAYEMRISDWSSDVCSSDLVERDRAGVDRPAPQRLLGQPGDVEIAIGRHQQRARDRRRRHHQGVDSLALAAEAHTLVHAEAMLLVDHRQREVAELDTFLEQRVGPDEDAGTALGDPPDHGREGLALVPAGQDLYAPAGLAGQRL